MTHHHLQTRRYSHGQGPGAAIDSEVKVGCPDGEQDSGGCGQFS